MRRVAVVTALFLIFSLFASPASGSEDLQALIDAAAPGSVLVLSAGSYEGNVIIDKPMELRGEGWPVVDGHGTGNVITVEAPDVTLTGLVIANTGTSLTNENAGVSANAPRVSVVNNRFENVLFGIFLRRADDSYVADNVIGAIDLDIARRGDGIRLWESSQSIVEGNVVDGGRDTVLWFSDDLILRGNSVTNGRYGIHFMYSDRALITGNYLSGNSVGGFLMYSKNLVLEDNLITNSNGPSGYGIGLKDMDGVTIIGNHLLANRVGIYLDNSPATPGVTSQIASNLFAYNHVGLLLQPSVSGNLLSGNSFIDNGEQVGVKGKGELLGNEWTVGELGNHWSDYAGYDADGNGIGDVPYRLADLYASLTDNNPELRFFNETPASKAVDLAGRMFPVIRPRPKVEDTAPLISPPAIPVPFAIPAPSTTLATSGIALAMTLAAASLWLVGRTPLRRSRR